MQTKRYFRRQYIYSKGKFSFYLRLFRFSLPAALIAVFFLVGAYDDLANAQLTFISTIVLIGLAVDILRKLKEYKDRGKAGRVDSDVVGRRIILRKNKSNQ